MDSRLAGLGRVRLGSRGFFPHMPNLLPLPSPNTKQFNDNTSSNDSGDDGNSSKNGRNQGGSHHPQNDNSPSSELPGDCNVNNLRQMAPHCTFLNDNNGSLQYSDGWIFTTSDPNGLIHTVHFAQSPEASVSLTFNTSSIIVFGLVPSGNSPPQASYSIDGIVQSSPHVASTTTCVPNQQFFNSGNLGAGPHNLTIDVTQASNNQPYILDYLWLCTDGSGTSENSNAPTNTEKHDLSPKDGIIIGTVLGVVFLLLAIGLCAWLYIRRRRKRKAQLRKLHLASSPVASWLYWNSEGNERQSMFTSSDDILANNPSSSSSSGTRKEMSYRKAVPTISLPPSVRMSAVSKATSLSRPPSFEPPGLEDPGGYPRRMERAPSIALPL